jgi:hypothetical protein
MKLLERVLGASVVAGTLLATLAAAPAKGEVTQQSLAWKARIRGSPGGAADLWGMWGMNDGTYGGKADIPDRSWFTRDLGAPVSIIRVFWIVRGLFHGPLVTTGTLLSSEDGVTWTRFWEDCGRLSLRKDCGVAYHGTELSLPIPSSAPSGSRSPCASSEAWVAEADRHASARVPRRVLPRPREPQKFTVWALTCHKTGTRGA